jgi:hypothetical protein
MRLAAALVCVAATARADVASGPSWSGPHGSGSLDFAVGAVPAGTVRGFAAPGGHADVGVELGRLRLQATGDLALWTDTAMDAPAARSVAPPTASGTFARLGVGARWTIAALAHDRSMRIYVEGDLGRQWLPIASRDDVGFGFGIAQAARLGATTLGGQFGIRVLVAPAAPHDDVSLFVVLGVGLGR